MCCGLKEFSTVQGTIERVPSCAREGFQIDLIDVGIRNTLHERTLKKGFLSARVDLNLMLDVDQLQRNYPKGLWFAFAQ